jgi:23S rRNA (pseudouridine1915-N3)-methyltransferase
MKLRIVWPGKTRNLQIAGLSKDYIHRIRRFLPLEISEVKESKLDAAVGAADRVVVLDPEGKSWSSEQFARFLQQHLNSDSRRLTFVIGDYRGLPEAVKQRADVRWSLSSLTFTHEIARVLVLEQIYRALTILRNVPYSK